MRKDLHKLLLCVATIGALCLTTAFCHAADSIEVVRAKADQGEASAQLDLGLSYFKGTGVVKDDAEAYKWFLLAGAQGDETARSNIPKIELRLTPQQRADGQRLAREFRPRNQPASKDSSP